jgi:hypothetical protein
VGETYWRRAVDLDFLVDEGVIDPEDRDLFWFAETAEEIMGWNVDPQGLGVIFDRAILPFVKEHIAPAIASILGRAELGLADVDRFACHPGGSKVLPHWSAPCRWSSRPRTHRPAVYDLLANLARRIADTTARVTCGTRIAAARTVTVIAARNGGIPAEFFHRFRAVFGGLGKCLFLSGWVTDREHGYRYQMEHPVTSEAWPAIPERLLKLWSDVTTEKQPPNLCLIDFYNDEDKLGLHQDRGESSLEAPAGGGGRPNLASVLQEGDKSANIHVRSGAIWGIPVTRVSQHRVQGLPASSLVRSALARCQPYQPRTS